MKKYGICMEVSGDLGMYADHTTGSESRSHPIPTPTAAKGMLESVCWLPSVQTQVVAIATCTQPTWMPYAYNSGSPIRKSGLIKEGNACQLREEVLVKPCFQIMAVLTPKPNAIIPAGKGHINQPHAMQEMFFKRLMRGQSYHPVSMGRKEFLATHFGRLTSSIASFDQKIGSMAIRYLSNDGSIDQEFAEVVIKDGIARFSEELVELRDGILVFSDYNIQNNIDFLTEKWSRKGVKRTA